MLSLVCSMRSLYGPGNRSVAAWKVQSPGPHSLRRGPARKIGPLSPLGSVPGGAGDARTVSVALFAALAAWTGPDAHVGCGPLYDQAVLVRATIQQIPPDNARTYDLETRDIVVEDAASYEEGKERIAPQVPEGWRIIGYSRW